MMKNILSLLTLLTICYVQETITYDVFLSSMKDKYSNDETRIVKSFKYLFSKEKKPIIKCVTPLFIEYLENKTQLSNKAIEFIEGLINKKRSKRADSYTSLSGKFLFTYDREGSNAVPLDDANSNSIPDYIENVANYLDFSFNELVTNLGLTDPINGTYNISFESMGFYGYTAPQGSSTHIVLHNTFLGFPENTDPDGNQLGAAKVTAAHEFQHAIQYATSGWTEGGWVELDATWTEEYVYDGTNDYYNYLESSSCQLTNPTQPLDNGGSGSYYDVIWQIYLTKTFGNDFVRKFWDRRKINTSESVKLTYDNTLRQYGSDIKESISQYFVYNFFTSTRSDATFGYNEANNYPLTPYQTTLSSIEEINTSSVSSWAVKYIKLAIDKNERIEINVTNADTDLKMFYVRKPQNEPIVIEPIDITSGTSDYQVTSVRSANEYEFLIVANTNYLGISQNYSVGTSQATKVLDGFELSNLKITEKNGVQEFIGKINVSANFNDNFTFSVKAGNGDDDNESFSLSNDSLFAAEEFDYEEKSSYKIRLNIYSAILDTNIERSFDIQILDLDEIAPEILIEPFFEGNQLRFRLNVNEIISNPLISENGVSRIPELVNDSTYIFSLLSDSSYVSYSIVADDLIGNRSVFNQSYTFPLMASENRFVVDEYVSISEVSGTDPFWFITKEPLTIFSDSLQNISDVYIISSVEQLQNKKIHFSLNIDGIEEPRLIGLYKYTDDNWTYVAGEANTNGILNVTLKDPVSGTYAALYNKNHELYVPEQFILNQNYPNPFNPITTITFELPAKTKTDLSIFNILGQKIKTLVNDVLDERIHEYVWDGTNISGQKVSSGIYFYRVETQFSSQAKRMVLIK